MDPPAAPEPSPQEVLRERWERETARKDRLGVYMRARRFGPELTRDEQARFLREEAIRASQRRYG